MKKMIACILSVLMLTAALTACGRKAPAQEAADGTHYTVGICNYVDDASLNQIVENLRAQLEKLGEGRGVQFDILYDNCNADTNLMSQIISNFQADGADLLVAVATPVAMSMQAATEGTDTPVVFAAVSDPVSVGLVDSLEAPGSNVTGTSDYLDTASVMNLIFAQNPDAKKIGLLYDVGQDSATSAIEAAKQYLTEKGVEYIERTGTTVDEIALAGQYRLIVAAVAVLLAAVLLGMFLRTRLGLAIRATGDNPDMVRSSSINPAVTTIVGLCLSNALTALSGCLLAQSQKSVNIDIGTGMVTVALASLLIGGVFLGRKKLPLRIFGMVLGAFVFRLVYTVALRFDMPAFMLKLVSAVVVVAAISIPYLKEQYPLFRRRMEHRMGRRRTGC